MLIALQEVSDILSSNNIHTTGILHVGACGCEELDKYEQLGITAENVVWVDALESKIKEAKDRGIPNVYHAVISDKDDDEVTFHVSNNIQSSSILEFGTHTTEHPDVVYVDEIIQKTVTLDTFFERNPELDPSKYNFWNFDIQGAELMALKGAVKNIQHVKVMYLEVNERELYKGGCLINEIDDYLSQYHFKRVHTNMTGWGWGDAIYVYAP